MFSSTSCSLVIALVSFLTLPSALTHAAPLSRHGGHHLSQSGVIALKSLKRDGNARFTYYDAGENACGSYDANTDYVSNLPTNEMKRRLTFSVPCVLIRTGHCA